MTKLLILTLYSGEGEYPYLLESLRVQTFADWDHVTFRNLPNKEAHRKLYSAVHENRSGYDWFLKLDGDMILRHPTAIERMLTEGMPGVDHILWPVLDFFSNSKIYGVHMFSNRATWDLRLPDLFVDPHPSVPGRQVTMPLTSTAPVLHATLPSPRQAFEFGVHRALKAFGVGAGRIDPVIRLGHMRTLDRVWRAFRASRDELRGLAILGAEQVRVGEIDALDYRGSPQADVHFENAVRLSAADIEARCRHYWGRRLPAEIFWLRAQRKFHQFLPFSVAPSAAPTEPPV